VVAVDKTASTDWLIQTAHALSHHGACTVVEEAASRDAWTRALRPLLASAPSRRRMQISLGNHFRRDGAWHLASMVRDTLGSAGRTRSA
jgi:hypothetical protein